jgi:hypothetical protein
MGCSGSKDLTEADHVNAQIENQLKKDKVALRYPPPSLIPMPEPCSLPLSLHSNRKKRENSC